MRPSWLLAGLLIAAVATACSPAASMPFTEADSAERADRATNVETTTPFLLKAASPVPPTQAATRTLRTLGSEENMTIPPDGSRPVDPTMQAMIERVQADLAQRLGLEISQISVVEAKAVEWHNSSLGCPQPGTMYAQVITPGYLIVLEVKGSIHEYHTDRGTTTFLCHSLPGLKLPPPKSADDRTPWQPVDSSSSTGTPWQTPNRP